MQETGEYHGGGGRRGGRENQWDKDWTKGNIVGNLLSLGWPMMVGGSLNMIGPTIDMIWVGKLGPAAIAGVGIAGMVVMLVNSAMAGLYQGLRAMVARAIGAGNPDEARHVAQQALVMTLIYSVVMAVIGLFFSEQILILMGMEPDVVADGAPYLRINFIGMITMSLRMVTEATMQASGDAKKPMWVAVFFRIFHVLLSPALIFGLLFFPKMGVTGAAVTNVLSQGLGAAIGLWYMTSGRTRLTLSMKNFRFDGKTMWKIIRIGIPASIMGMEMNLGNLVLVKFISPFGTSAVAAHSLNQRVAFFIGMPAMGLGQASGVLVGQNLGAKQPERAMKTGSQCAGMLTILMAVFAGIILLWAEYAVRIFSSDPDLIIVASAFIRIGAVAYLVTGVTNAFQQSISGAGDTFPPMLVTLGNLWLVQVPLAFFLRSTSLGVYGVRWAMAAGVFAAAVAYTVYYYIGRWKNIKV
jgi:putative MATE family efflux protein